MSDTRLQELIPKMRKANSGKEMLELVMQTDKGRPLDWELDGDKCCLQEKDLLVLICVLKGFDNQWGVHIRFKTNLGRSEFWIALAEPCPSERPGLYSEKKYRVEQETLEIAKRYFEAALTRAEGRTIEDRRNRGSKTPRFPDVLFKMH